MGKKRGRKPAKILCSFDIVEYDFEDLIKIHKLGLMPYSTYVHKKYKNNLPTDWKYSE